MAKTTTQKIYVLELYGEPVNSGGVVIIEIGGVSSDMSFLKALKAKKDKELTKYFSKKTKNSYDDDDDDDCYCYYNSDYSSRPSWDITEYDLLGNKK